MKRLVLFVFAVGCDAPYVDVADTANVADVAVDTGPELPWASRALPDGGVCEGHDEDRDGWPDQCDVCPGVKDPTQTAGADGIGVACAPAKWSGSLARRLFDPLVSLDAWGTVAAAYGGFRILPEAPGDVIGGDTSTAGFGKGVTAHAIRAEAYSTAKGLVLLAAVNPGGGIGEDKVGAFVRGRGADEFVGCYISGSNQLAIVQTDPISGCTPRVCSLSQVGEAKFPTRVGWERPTLRIEARDLPEGGGTITCKVFDASGHLMDTDTPNATVSASIDAEHWGTGTSRPAIGLFAQNGIGTFSWVDVLVVR